MSARERFVKASMAMAELVKEQSAIENKIHILRNQLQTLKNNGWRVRQEYRESHEALLKETMGDALSEQMKDWIPPAAVAHDRDPDEDD